MSFRVLNATRSKLIANQSEIAQTIFSRSKGLLGRKCLNKGEALIIKSCNSIHTFFMQFAIDVIFVDKNDRVVRAIENIKPFRLSPIILKSSYVIELSVGAIRSSSTQAGDQLKIESL